MTTFRRIGPLLTYLLAMASIAWAFAQLVERYPPMP
jgi:hypothetical protein